MLFDGVNEVGTTALAFANTACPDGGTDSRELADVLASLTASGAIDAETERRLVSAFAETPDAERAVEAILRFRTVVVDVLEALRSGGTPSNDSLQAVNKELSRCGCVRELVRDGDIYRTEMLFEINAPEDVLMPIAHSLADILTSAPRERLKQCREPRCSCYFIDTSKSATRAWCSMQRCGNRQKVANYYRRERGRVRQSSAM
jgi:predicted RNA-binding Zn ribbon-like protein